jgi:hypothetical protein
MDALVENASQPRMPLKEQDLLEAGAGCANSNRHACRPASNDHDIVVVKGQHKQLKWSPGVLEYEKTGVMEDEKTRNRSNGVME